MNSILEIENLEKNYYTKQGEIKAIDNISLKIKEGEIITIVGTSGCGKSSLLGILANIEDKTNGKIKYQKDKPTIGYMLQNDALFPWLTIFDNAILGLKIAKKDTLENKEYVKNLLKTYNLEEFINKYPNELSGGMRQRVALIRTLALKPDILLLDEPFSALDYQSRLAVSADVFKIIKRENITTILVSHDVGEAVSLSNKVVVLSKRPCKIKKIYDIDLPYDNPIDNRNTKEFNELYNKIWKDLDVYVN